MNTITIPTGRLSQSPVRRAEPRIGNELHPHSGVSMKLDYTCLHETTNDEEVKELAVQAKKLRGAGLVVRAESLQTARSVVKREDALKVTAAVGYSESGQIPSQERILSDIDLALTQSPDELEVYLPNSSTLQAHLTEIVARADRTPVRLALPEKICDSQLQLACQVAQAAGAKFIKLDNPSDAQLQLMTESCDLSLVVGGELQSAAEALDITEAWPKRRWRFATSDGGPIVAEEGKAWTQKTPELNKELQAKLASPGGKKFRQMVDNFHSQMVARIDRAHDEGRPVAFMSVCIRPNDVNSIEDNMKVRDGLRKTCTDADVAFIDPFELLEPVIQSLKAGEVEGDTIEEVFMDPEAGLWPDLVRRCDTMIHGDRWKFAQGAREEHEMAEFYGIPYWDGTGRPEIRNASAQNFQFHQGASSNL